jgi:ABC-type dipeptide/oligopeptide/nickel transport system permease component
MEVILQRLPATLELATLALIISLAGGVTLGVIAGMVVARGRSSVCHLND